MRADGHPINDDGRVTIGAEILCGDYRLTLSVDPRVASVTPALEQKRDEIRQYLESVVHVVFLIIAKGVDHDSRH
jgi:hypothetical protein